MTFIFWELVGVSSYILIGFWFERPSAAAAAVKAFVVNRIGDFDSCSDPGGMGDARDSPEELREKVEGGA